MSGFLDFFGGMAREASRDMRETHKRREDEKSELSLYEKKEKIRQKLEDATLKKRPVKTKHTKGPDGKWYAVPTNVYDQAVGEPVQVSTAEAQELEKNEVLSKNAIDESNYSVGDGRKLAEDATRLGMDRDRSSISANAQQIKESNERMSDADKKEREEMLVTGYTAVQDLKDMSTLIGKPDPIARQDAVTLEAALKTIQEGDPASEEYKAAVRAYNRIAPQAKARRANLGTTAADKLRAGSAGSDLAGILEAMGKNQ